MNPPSSYVQPFGEPGREDHPEHSPAPAAFAGVLAFLFLLVVLSRSGPSTRLPSGETAARLPAPRQPVPAAPDPGAFAAPYSDYVITQGVHGASYGQMAVDLAAGKGAAILSPINGTVTGVYIDGYGNPTLTIENELFIVKMLHGDYTAREGELLRIGDPVGFESNRGYTTDMRGVPCAGRRDPCGYHTHLNVYSKTLETNVNPLELLGP